MATSMRTFAGHLKQFSRSVDIVDGHTFDLVRDLVFRYVKVELGEGAYFELLRPQEIDREPGLYTFWSSEEKLDAWPTMRDGKYRRPAAVSFVEDKPVWMVNTDKAPLSHSACHQDQWSAVADLPLYVRAVDRPIRTSIMVPLRRRSVLGVFRLDTPVYIDASEVAKSELLLLGDALAILLDLWQVNQSQSSLTQDAISDLNAMLRSANFPKLAKPQVFVSYSERADQQVIDMVRVVLDGYRDKVDITYWRDMTDPGSIPLQISQKITQSTYGICYFSERVDSPTPQLQFADNPNVIFEAGMVHAMTTAADGRPSGWIPIRERKSPEVPFDFANVRTLYVPRSVNDEIDHERFKKELEAKVTSLLREV